MFRGLCCEMIFKANGGGHLLQQSTAWFVPQARVRVRRLADLRCSVACLLKLNRRLLCDVDRETTCNLILARCQTCVYDQSVFSNGRCMSLEICVSCDGIIDEIGGCFLLRMNVVLPDRRLCGRLQLGVRLRSGESKSVFQEGFG